MLGSDSKKKYRFSVLTSGVFKSRETLQAFRTRKKLLLDLENRAWRVSITFVLCKANNSVYTAVHKYETSNVFALIQLLELPLPFKKQNPNYCCFFFCPSPKIFPLRTPSYLPVSVWETDKKGGKQLLFYGCFKIQGCSPKNPYSYTELG